jgi:formylmethanofuran dehydrogenase subunit E
VIRTFGDMRCQKCGEHATSSAHTCPQGWTHRSPRDWVEDFPHENGNYSYYSCKCHVCGQFFLGHKRRIGCKLCATTPTEATP